MLALSFAAVASPINVGVLSLVTATTPNPPFPGTVGFQVDNNVGDPAGGGSALPPDFPIFTNLILLNLNLTYVIGGNSQSLSLGNLMPGSYFPPAGQQFPDTTLFDSAILTGTLSSSIFTLFDSTVWQATSPDFSAVLLPSSGATLLQDVDLVVFTVDAQPLAAATPEPSAVLLAVSGLMLLLPRRSRQRGNR
jgi:hypothetical protein